MASVRRWEGEDGMFRSLSDLLLLDSSKAEIIGAPPERE
jgi:hypothetical protein